MTDPLRSETTASTPQVPEHEREARVEDLLLGGLDHYFAGHHDLAINVWTRVLFLDRGHARARAYIERARGAISERQRQGDELIHTGAEAFHRGEADVARRLLTSAVEHGAGTEEALMLLDRLDRLEAAAVHQESRTPREPAARQAHDVTGLPTDRSPVRWLVAVAPFGIAAASILIGVLWFRGGAWFPLGVGTSPGATVRVIDEPLPVPSAADVWLARAHAQKDRGHLREALVALDAIRTGDRLSAEADKLRAEIQADLLAAGRAGDLAAPGHQDTRRQ